ncbi:MAG: protein kinase [Eubacteriales bacterium]|nr:protein kinase [Eubacteriales bacterium]
MQKGQILNNTYEVLGPLNEGAAGEVFLAWHLNLGKYVVVKKIKERFLGKINERQEADILKKLHHGNIPQVYDFVQMEEAVYTVIDHVDGMTLQQYIERGDFFPEAEIIRLMRQMLDALSYMHSQKPPVIHNDIKPANVMIRKDGNLCLIDFNISFGEYDKKDMKGYTRGFASPEQEERMRRCSTGGNYRDIVIDGRSDLFSMGACFYYLMTGDLATERMKNGWPLWDHNIQYPYSEQLREIISGLLQVRCEDRFASAEDVLSEINNMKRKDRELRRLETGQMVFSLVFTVLTAVGILGGILGYQTRLSEQFRTDSRKAEELYEEGNYEAATELGEQILNEPKYQKAMKSDPEETAKVMYTVGDICFRDEDYRNASKFFAMAAQTDNDKGSYYRDWAISLIRSGELDEADQVLEQAEDAGVESADLNLVRGELALKNGSAGEAVKLLEKAVKNSDSDETTARAAIVLADAKNTSGDLSGAVDVLEDVKDELTGNERRDVLRNLARIYILELSSNNSKAGEYADDAETVFEELTGSPELMTIEDWMNYVDLKNMQQKYDEANEILEAIQKEYPKDYRIPMQRAKTELYIQASKSENQDYGKVEDCYNEAVKLFADVKRNGVSDPRMDVLERKIAELKQAGWLQ